MRYRLVARSPANETNSTNTIMQRAACNCEMLYSQIGTPILSLKKHPPQRSTRGIYSWPLLLSCFPAALETRYFRDGRGNCLNIFSTALRIGFSAVLASSTLLPLGPCFIVSLAVPRQTSFLVLVSEILTTSVP